MEKTFDSVAFYSGYFGCPAWCRVRIFQETGKTPVVVLSEMESNEGTSVTNAVETIASGVDKWMGEPDAGLHVIEHYPDRAPLHDKPPFGERFTLVEMTKTRTQGFVQPKWTHLTREEVEVIIGQPLAG